MKEVIIESSARAWSAYGTPCVVLKEKYGSRRLSIPASSAEMETIARGQELLETLLPAPNNIRVTLQGAFSGTVRRTIITGFGDAEQTFYGTVVMDAAGVSHEVELGAIDALAHAVRAKAPIFVEEELLAWAARKEASRRRRFPRLGPSSKKPAI